MSSLGRMRRKLSYAKYNFRDFIDAYLAPNLKVRSTPMGFDMIGGNSRHHKAMQAGTFERLEVDWLQDMLPKVDVFVDVGANIGYFSCIARALGKHVVSVEPLPANLALLLQNVTANEGPPVEIFPVALASEPGVAKLYGLSSTGASLLSNWAGAPSSVARLIPVNTLDNLLENRFLNNDLLVKIDVEGYEYQALCGAIKILDRKRKPVWLVEITHSQYHPAGENPFFRKTFELFWSRGYRCCVLTDSGVKRVVIDDFEGLYKLEREGHINFIFSEQE